MGPTSLLNVPVDLMRTHESVGSHAHAHADAEDAQPTGERVQRAIAGAVGFVVLAGALAAALL